MFGYSATYKELGEIDEEIGLKGNQSKPHYSTFKKEDNAFTTHHLQQWLEVNDLPKEVLLSLRKNNLFAQQQKSDEETPAMALEPRQAYTS